MKSLDRQVGGDHYITRKIQPLEFILHNDLNFLEGSVVKRICRHSVKNPSEGLIDLQKAIHELEVLKEFYYKDPPREEE